MFDFELKLMHYNEVIPDLTTQSIAAGEYIKKYAETLAMFETRQQRLEKKLTFLNIQEPMMNYDWSETQTRGIVEEIVKPTQKRMVEIQDRFGKICDM